MTKNEFFRGFGTIVQTPQDLKDIMTSAIIGMDRCYNMAEEAYFATANLYGREIFPVAVLEMSLIEDPTNIGCLFCVPEVNAICFWYGKFECVKATAEDIGKTFSTKLDDCVMKGIIIERDGKLCLEYKTN